MCNVFLSIPSLWAGWLASGMQSSYENMAHAAFSLNIMGATNYGQGLAPAWRPCVLEGCTGCCATAAAVWCWSFWQVAWWPTRRTPWQVWHRGRLLGGARWFLWLQPWDFSPTYGQPTATAGCMNTCDLWMQPPSCVYDLEPGKKSDKTLLKRTRTLDFFWVIDFLAARLLILLNIVAT